MNAFACASPAILEPKYRLRCSQYADLGRHSEQKEPEKDQLNPQQPLVLCLLSATENKISLRTSRDMALVVEFLRIIGLLKRKFLFGDAITEIENVRHELPDTLQPPESAITRLGCI